MWRCQHSSDLTNCDTGQFLDQIELFFVGMPNQATPGMKPGDTRDGTVRHPGMEPVDPGMEPVDTRNGTGRHPEWNRSTPGMEPASQFSFFFWPARKLSVKTVKSVKRPGGRKRASKASILLSLWRVFQFHVLCQLQALFREMPKNLVFRRPADFRASRCQDVQSLELRSACKPAVCWLRSYSRSL